MTEQKKPIVQRLPQYTYRKCGPAVGYAPAEGAVAFIEVDPDPTDPTTLLVPADPVLVCDRILTFAIYSVERTHEDGYVDWTHEPYPVTLDGDLERWHCVLWPDGSGHWGDGRGWTNDDRLRMLRARLKFEKGG